jgi:hypothetical protein
VSLGAELAQKIELLYGLYAVSAKSIGMRAELDPDESVELEAAETHARSWLAAWREDSDLNRDPRVIVPIARDLESQTVRYWAVIGVRALRIRAEFYPGHEPELVGAGFCSFRSFVAHEPYTLIEKQVEVTLPMSRPPPTRDELRALCDEHDNADDIVTALESF